MAVSTNWGLGVLVKRALLFWVYVRAPDVWKLPTGFEANHKLTDST